MTPIIGKSDRAIRALYEARWLELRASHATMWWDERVNIDNVSQRRRALAVGYSVARDYDIPPERAEAILRTMIFRTVAEEVVIAEVP